MHENWQTPCALGLGGPVPIFSLRARRTAPAPLVCSRIRAPVCRHPWRSTANRRAHRSDLAMLGRAGIVTRLSPRHLTPLPLASIHPSLAPRLRDTQGNRSRCIGSRSANTDAFTLIAWYAIGKHSRHASTQISRTSAALCPFASRRDGLTLRCGAYLNGAHPHPRVCGVTPLTPDCSWSPCEYAALASGRWQI